MINSDVDIEYVALLQRPTVRYPVSCHVIHRARNTLREPLERIYVCSDHCENGKCVSRTSKFSRDGYELFSTIRSRANISREKFVENIEGTLLVLYQWNWDFMM